MRDFLRTNATARRPVDRWIEIAKNGYWTDITDMRKSLPTADAIRGTNLTCFNIGGNKYRLLANVSYQRQTIVIRELLTHEQYTRKYGS